MTRDELEAVVQGHWLDLQEKDDRTSPEEYPDMCLINRDEFAAMFRPMRNGLELASAAEALLATTTEERSDPRIWWPRVDALKLAIAVMRGTIPHGHDVVAQPNS